MTTQLDERYEGKSNYGKPKIDYVNKLREMEDEKLFAEAKQMIYLSAYANNNPRSDYHWQCDACYDVMKERNSESCSYSQAHKEVMKENGY